MLRKTGVLVLVLAFVVATVGLANASTSAEKQAAIDLGLKYLASTQQANGSWTNGYGGATFASAFTAAALLAFTEQKYKPVGWNGADYTAVVTNATNYLLSQATTLPFAAGGNWWGFGAGSSGIRWSAGGEDTYITGLALPALSRLVTNPYGGSPIYQPTAVISSTNAVVNGRTYAQVIQKVVDAFTYYKTGPAYGNRYGGWRYIAGNNDSDMSTTQWPVIGYYFAGQVPGVTIPDSTVKNALQEWITVCQNPTTGGVDYQPGAGIINATHAGGFILSHLFAGGGGDLAKAVSWLNDNWLNGPSGTWFGNEGNPYAMWAVYKALETLYGGTNTVGDITNLHTQTTALDPGAVWNWWEDYCQYLVESQNADGSWPGYAYWDQALEAAWYINILNATRTAPPIPIPGHRGPLGNGHLGSVRRRLVAAT